MCRTEPSGIFPEANPVKSIFRPGLFRLFLAVLVVLQHSGILEIGVTAVNVFFLLSGFWISSMWQSQYRACRLPYSSFVISRFWRLAPLYWCCWLMSGVLFFLFPIRWADVQTYANLTWVVRSLAIVSSAGQPQWLPQGWSLDIEMQFYLIAPMLLTVLLTLQQRGNRIFVSSVFFAVAGSVVLLFATPLCWISRDILFFLAGVLVQLSGWQSSRRFALLSLAVSVAVCGLMVYYPPLGKAAGWAKYLPALAAMVALPFVAWNVRQPSPAFDRHLGNLSYSVYVFHRIPVLALNNTTAFGIGTIGRTRFLLLSWLLIAVGSLLLYLLVDRPIEAWRHRFVKARQAMGKRAAAIATVQEIATAT